MDLFRNFAYTGVLVPPTPANLGTSLTVYNGTSARFPAAPFSVSVWPLGLPADPTNAEILRVTAKAGDIWTIQRQQEGTSARAILLNDQIAQALTIKALDDLKADIVAAAVAQAKTYTDTRDTALYNDYVARDATVTAQLQAWVNARPRIEILETTPNLFPNVDAYDMVHVWGLQTTMGVQNPVGTPHDGQLLVVRIRDNNVARTLGWGTAYMSGVVGLLLPGVTRPLRTMHVGLRYNFLYARWQMIGFSEEP